MKSKIFISLFMATLIVMLSIGIVAPILPLYARNMHASGLEIGLIFSGFALSRFLLAPLVGRFADQHRKKRVIVAGLLLFIAVSLCFVAADSPTMLVIVRMAQGLASVLVTPVAQSYVGDITPVSQEGKYGNLFFMSLFLGQALGPYLGGHLSDRFSLNMPFYAMSALSVAALILILFCLPDAPAVAPKKKTHQPLFKSLLPVFEDGPMLGVMAYFSSRGFYRWGFNTFFPVLAVKATSASLTSVGVILSIYMLCSSLVQYPCGLLVDKYPRHKIKFILLGGIPSALAMSLVGQFDSMIMFFLLSMAMGLFSAVSRASSIAIQTERGRIYGMGSAAGAFTSSLSFGQVAGPLVLGVIVDAYDIPVAFLVGGAVGLVGTLAAAALLRAKSGK